MDRGIFNRGREGRREGRREGEKGREGGREREFPFFFLLSFLSLTFPGPHTHTHTHRGDESAVVVEGGDALDGLALHAGYLHICTHTHTHTRTRARARTHTHTHTHTRQVDGSYARQVNGVFVPGGLLQVYSSII